MSTPQQKPPKLRDPVLVALNHPFGAFYGPFLPPEQQEALVQSLLDAMIPVQGWAWT